mgnify:CR=1 FL=1
MAMVSPTRLHSANARGTWSKDMTEITACAREAASGSGEDSFTPFPEGKGCLLVGMSPRGLVSVWRGDDFAPSPLGEGWGEVLN